ncbi:MAG: DODA-type extradiol aromatic ring-opening family dioxygenase [Polyangiaceae bacterium]
MKTLQPTLYIPHGGGPCFFMDWTMGPPDTWNRLAAWLRAMPTTLPAPPAALLVVSAHWEAHVPTVTAGAMPPLVYDYSGFPAHTYELSWPAPGSPELAARVRALLDGAGIASAADARRGFDHGVFVPLKVSYPEARIPTVQLSLVSGLDPTTHLAVGHALAPLRSEGVLIVGSGMSYHNMRGLMTAGALAHSRRFDAWLAAVVEGDPGQREASLAQWMQAPSARESHPREEHLLPLMVAAGAAGDETGTVAFRDVVMDASVSAVRFGSLAR